ncbi:MAG: SPOR domain-containing protein [Thermodesulfobacteriota bacterium]
MGLLKGLFLLPGRMLAWFRYQLPRRRTSGLGLRPKARPGLEFLVSVIFWAAAAWAAISLFGGRGTGTDQLQVSKPQATSTESDPAQTKPQPAAEDKNWYVLLRSVPKSSRKEAERRLKIYNDAGLNAQILDSSEYPRLKGGYWVIAIGPFTTRDEAEAMTEKVKPSVPDAFLRQVK